MVTVVIMAVMAVTDITVVITEVTEDTVDTEVSVVTGSVVNSLYIYSYTVSINYVSIKSWCHGFEMDVRSESRYYYGYFRKKVLIC